MVQMDLPKFGFLLDLLPTSGWMTKFWADIIDDASVEPFQVSEGVKLTSKSYKQFSDKHLAHLVGWTAGAPPM